MVFSPAIQGGKRMSLWLRSMPSGMECKRFVRGNQGMVGDTGLEPVTPAM